MYVLSKLAFGSDVSLELAIGMSITSSSFTLDEDHLKTTKDIEKNDTHVIRDNDYLTDDKLISTKKKFISTKWIQLRVFTIPYSHLRSFVRYLVASYCLQYYCSMRFL